MTNSTPTPILGIINILDTVRVGGGKVDWKVVGIDHKNQVAELRDIKTSRTRKADYRQLVRIAASAKTQTELDTAEAERKVRYAAGALDRYVDRLDEEVARLTSLLKAKQIDEDNAWNIERRQSRRVARIVSEAVKTLRTQNADDIEFIDAVRALALRKVTGGHLSGGDVSWREEKLREHFGWVQLLDVAHYSL